MEKKVLQEMFDNLLHIWTKKRYWNSKMKDSIYGTINGVSIINLLETSEKLEKVRSELEEMTKNGKKILFVATKMQSKSAVTELAEATWHYYVTEKFVPWLLTNFKTIKRRISTYLKLLKDRKMGSFDILSKKEKAAKMLELQKLDKAFSWLKDIKRLPDVVFVCDGVYENQALMEAQKLGIKTYALLNTNGDIDSCDEFVPINTNFIKSIEFVTNYLKTSIKSKEAKKEVKKTIKKLEAKK